LHPIAPIAPIAPNGIRKPPFSPLRAGAARLIGRTSNSARPRHFQSQPNQPLLRRPRNGCVTSDHRPETEKLLFYRGIAHFGIDLNAVVHPDGVSLRNQEIETIPEAILFENHSGQIGYTVIRNLREPANVRFSALTGSLDTLRSYLEQELVEMGLYPKEAHAMVETWRDSWFEEGLRVFYILPRAKVDTLLPISIQPAPSQLARVFVGRIELLSPQMKQDITTALATGDVPTLKKYSRFLNAFMRQMDAPPMSERSRQFINDLYAQAQIESQKLSCTQ
jgi:hypothetical protein